MGFGFSEYRSAKLGYLLVAIILLVLFPYFRSTTDQHRIFSIPTLRQLASSAVFAILVTIGGFAAIGLQVLITAQVSLDMAASLWDFSGNEFTVTARYQYLGRNSGAFNLLLFLTTQALMLPLAEEVYFRGLILEKYVAKLGSAGAVLITSVLFTLPHAGSLYLSTFIFSLLICTHFLLYRNIWLVFLIHGWSNLMDWLISGYGGLDYIESHAPGELAQPSTWVPELVLAGICVALCCWILYRKNYQRHCTTDKEAAT